MPANLNKPIRSLEELAHAANEKKAVIVPKSRTWNRPIPAIYMINSTGNVLVDLFKLGVYIYEK